MSVKVFLGFLAFSLFAVSAAKKEGKTRDGKLLSLFQIVTFPNDPCPGSSNRNGTCYTAEECASRGGASEGSCAQGYGVCCTFSATCGATSSENCTYFDSAGGETGQCQLTICRCNSQVCQLRLDFNQFTITGPSTMSVSSGSTLNGQPVATKAGKTVSTASQCLTDTFTVSNPGNCRPPTICGTNTGEHMYVDAAEACNDLTFALGQTAMGVGAVANRQWSIKVTQLTCDSPSLAPDGCTQYFADPTGTGTIQSFNFAGGQHLASQNQNICIRRERGQCRICYTAVMDTDFAVSGMTAMMKGIISQSMCCQYNTDGMGVSGGDCVVIPGALNANAMMSSKFAASRICGRSKGLVTSAAGTMPKTVCSRRMPFSLRFLSDSFEFGVINEAKKADLGFMLTYIQDAINCN